MTSKRLRKLRRVYAPRASRQRLRLTDKRIRKLERERIGSGKSFEKVWRSYRKGRIEDSINRIYRKFSPEFPELNLGIAKAARALAIKEDLTYREAILRLLGPGLPPPPPPGQMEFMSNWTDFRRRCKELEKAQSKNEDFGPEFFGTETEQQQEGKIKERWRVSPDFVLAAKFGKKEYEGDLANFPHVSWREQGDKLFGPAEKEPYWTMVPGLVEGFTYYEKREGVNVLTRFEVVVATDLSNLEKFQ